MSNDAPPLSNRLQLVFDQLIPGEPVWDLCCDHGKLGARALSSGQFGRVHFVDSAAHLVERLRSFSKSDNASFYGMPAQAVPDPWSGTVVATGVGGHTLIEILSARQGDLGAKRFVLGPHRDEEKLKQWLSSDPRFSKNYELKCQFSVRERGRERWLFVYDELTCFPS